LHKISQPKIAVHIADNFSYALSISKIKHVAQYLVNGYHQGMIMNRTLNGTFIMKDQNKSRKGSDY
jgi:hypothetical protein